MALAHELDEHHFCNTCPEPHACACVTSTLDRLHPPMTRCDWCGAPGGERCRRIGAPGRVKHLDAGLHPSRMGVAA